METDYFFYKAAFRKHIGWNDLEMTWNVLQSKYFLVFSAYFMFFFKNVFAKLVHLEFSHYLKKVFDCILVSGILTFILL